MEVYAIIQKVIIGDEDEMRSCILGMFVVKSPMKNIILFVYLIGGSGYLTVFHIYVKIDGILSKKNHLRILIYETIFCSPWSP